MTKVSLSVLRAKWVSHTMAGPALTTVRDILEKTTTFFAGKGIPSARLDAELLLAEVLGYDRLRLYLNLDRPMDEDEIACARELVRRRATREPIAYILGRREFAGRDFAVGPGVLIPRPDTEVLVETALEQLRTTFADRETVRVLEFGAGSGAIGVTLAAEDARVRVIATEIVEKAQAAARQNAETHGVADRVDVRLQKDFDGLGPQSFEMLISNPPYIAEEERPTLEPDVADFEPAEALFAPESGLYWYDFLAGEAVRLLVPGGLLAVEIGYRQREAVEWIFQSAKLADVRSLKDYAGHDRVVMGYAANAD